MIVVLISANVEWAAARDLLPRMKAQQSPFGEWGEPEPGDRTAPHGLVFFHGGWGKIDAAASTQFVIDRFSPTLVINIGTCGGFAGRVDVGQVLLAERTIVYDIREKMFDPDQAIQEYATTLDLDWIKDCPSSVTRSVLVSGDSDLDPSDISALSEKYGASAGDWESGAIAHVCHLNHLPCLILRGVSDLVGPERGEAYDDPRLFQTRTPTIMSGLIASLPLWVDMFRSSARQASRRNGL